MIQSNLEKIDLDLPIAIATGIASSNATIAEDNAYRIVRKNKPINRSSPKLTINSFGSDATTEIAQKTGKPQSSVRSSRPVHRAIVMI